jgi:hypothetical protein
MEPTMPLPAWLGCVLAAVMIAVAGYHGVRLVAACVLGRLRGADVGATHVAMGIGMVLMLTGALTPSGSRWWTLGFGAATVWFTWRTMYAYVMDGTAETAAHLRQAVATAAMLYMLLAAARPAVTPPTGHAGMEMHASPGTSGLATVVPDRAVGLLLAAVVAAVAAWTGRGLASSRRMPDARAALPHVVTGCCQLAMNVTAVLMLLAMA